MNLFIHLIIGIQKDIVLINIKNLENPKQECWII